ncbi:hypothetical protein VNO77_19969 [Canavalia gladiata]|uniref:Uncharacterized protein n=1 Tax=Canavalia gladiata TaxID=3824 RepID=A0AAN9LNG5_CANGL
MLCFSTFNRRLWKILPLEDSGLLEIQRFKVLGSLLAWGLKRRYANDFVHSYIEPAMVILRKHGCSGLVLCFLCKLPGSYVKSKNIAENAYEPMQSMLGSIRLSLDLEHYTPNQALGLVVGGGGGGKGALLTRRAWVRIPHATYSTYFHFITKGLLPVTRAPRVCGQATPASR